MGMCICVFACFFLFVEHHKRNPVFCSAFVEFFCEKKHASFFVDRLVLNSWCNSVLIFSFLTSSRLRYLHEAMMLTAAYILRFIVSLVCGRKQSQSYGKWKHALLFCFSYPTAAQSQMWSLKMNWARNYIAKLLEILKWHSPRHTKK